MADTIVIDGIECEVTKERISRINQAIAETKRQIDREMRYIEKFRKNDDIAFWKAHIKKLEAMKNVLENAMIKSSVEAKQ